MAPTVRRCFQSRSRTRSCQQDPPTRSVDDKGRFHPHPSFGATRSDPGLSWRRRGHGRYQRRIRMAALLPTPLPMVRLAAAQGCRGDFGWGLKFVGGIRRSPGTAVPISRFAPGTEKIQKSGPARIFENGNTNISRRFHPHPDFCPSTFRWGPRVCYFHGSAKWTVSWMPAAHKSPLNR